MTATWSHAARRRLLSAAASAGLAFSFLGTGWAAAQDDASSADAACAAERCLAVRIDPSVIDGLRAGHEVSTQQLADGVVVDFEGESPLAVRLIAARYDRGRLVRYGVSQRTEIEAGRGLRIPDALAVVDKAFQPVTTRTLGLSALDHALLEEAMPVSMDAFVGEVPSAYLSGVEERALVPTEVLPAEDLPETFDGSIGVIAIVPDDDALRGPEQVAVEGALVRLHYERPSRSDAPTG